MLSGSGPSQLGISGSMRARDVSRPHEDDVAEAERLVQVSYRPRSRPHPVRPDGSAPQDSPASQEGRGGSSPERS